MLLSKRVLLNGSFVFFLVQHYRLINMPTQQWQNKFKNNRHCDIAVCMGLSMELLIKLTLDSAVNFVCTCFRFLHFPNFPKHKQMINLNYSASDQDKAVTEDEWINVLNLTCSVQAECQLYYADQYMSCHCVVRFISDWLLPFAYK